MRVPHDLVGKLSISSGWWLPQKYRVSWLWTGVTSPQTRHGPGLPSAVAANYTAAGTFRTYRIDPGEVRCWEMSRHGCSVPRSPSVTHERHHPSGTPAKRRPS